LDGWIREAGDEPDPMRVVIEVTGDGRDLFKRKERKE
jgi:hypothetical protein